MAEKRKDSQADTKDTAQTNTKDTGQSAATAPPAKKGKPSQYTVDELVAASEKVLGVPRECAVVALRTSKKETMTVDEAKKIVKKFMEQEVG